MNDNIDYEIPDTEKYRLLILCSSVLNEKEFFKIKTGNKGFDYFKNGLKNSTKFRIDKRKEIETIINKLVKLEGLKEIIKSIEKLITLDSFYS